MVTCSKQHKIWHSFMLQCRKEGRKDNEDGGWQHVERNSAHVAACGCISCRIRHGWNCRQREPVHAAVGAKHRLASQLSPLRSAQGQKRRPTGCSQNHLCPIITPGDGRVFVMSCYSSHNSRYQLITCGKKCEETDIWMRYLWGCELEEWSLSHWQWVSHGFLFVHAISLFNWAFDYSVKTFL